MKNKGFLLMETLICGLLMGIFLIILIQAHGSLLFSMERCRLLHYGLNGAEASLAGMTSGNTDYVFWQEQGVFRKVRVKYRDRVLFGVYHAP